MFQKLKSLFRKSNTPAMSYCRNKPVEAAYNLRSTESIQQDFDDIGITKLISHEALSTLNQRGISISELQTSLEDRNLIFYNSSPEECGLGGESGVSGGVWAYDPDYLQQFLNSNRLILDQYEWPTNPREFVKKLITSRANPESEPELYDLIALAYNDRRYANYKPEESGVTPFDFTTIGGSNTRKPLTYLKLRV